MPESKLSISCEESWNNLFFTFDLQVGDNDNRLEDLIIELLTDFRALCTPLNTVIEVLISPIT